jgi:hypothetical protein
VIEEHGAIPFGISQEEGVRSLAVPSRATEQEDGKYLALYNSVW